MPFILKNLSVAVINHLVNYSWLLWVTRYAQDVCSSSPITLVTIFSVTYYLENAIISCYRYVTQNVACDTKYQERCSVASSPWLYEPMINSLLLVGNALVEIECTIYIYLYMLREMCLAYCKEDGRKEITYPNRVNVVVNASISWFHECCCVLVIRPTYVMVNQWSLRERDILQLTGDNGTQGDYVQRSNYYVMDHC